MKERLLHRIKEALEIPNIPPDVRARVWATAFDRVSPPREMRNIKNWHQHLTMLSTILGDVKSMEHLAHSIISSDQSYTVRTRIHMHLNGRISENDPELFEAPDPSTPARALDIYIHSLSFMTGLLGSLVNLVYADNPPSAIIEKLMEISKVTGRDQEAMPDPHQWTQNTLVWLRGLVNHLATMTHQTEEEEVTDEKALKSFFDNPNVLQKLSFTAHQVPLLTEVGVVAEITRIGFQTLRTTFPAMSDDTWFNAVQHVLEQRKEEGSYDDPEDKIKDEMLEKRVAEYLDTRTTEEGLTPLTMGEKIPVDLFKTQLDEAMQRCDHQTIDTMIRVIAEFILKEISPYSFAAFHPAKDGYATVGTPRGAIHMQQVSCFMSTWITASLLMECGVPEERILFARVTRSFSGQIGEHGALMVLGNRSVIYVNPTFNNVVTLKEHDGEIYTEQFLPLFTWAEVLRLEMLKKGALMHLPIPRRIEFPQGDAPDKMAQSMEVYPLNLGITGQFMSHLGLTFMQEGDLEAADFAHRLSVGATPISTYSWYNWGMSAYIQDDLTNAKKRWENALELFRDNHTARMGLACIELLHKKRPNKRNIKRLLNPVAKEKGSIWQLDPHIKSIARTTLDMIDSGRIDEARVELGKIMHYI